MIGGRKMKPPTLNALDWIIAGVAVGGVIVELYRYFTHQGVDFAGSLLLILSIACYLQMRRDRLRKKEADPDRQRTTRGM
jgi:hypothetical protein